MYILYTYYIYRDYTSEGIIGVRSLVYPPIDCDYNLHIILYSIIRGTIPHLHKLIFYTSYFGYA